MSKLCLTCSVPLYRYNRSGYCKSCYRKSPEGLAVTRRAISARLESQATRSDASRLASFQVRKGASECWGWSGSHNGVGYGKMRIRGRYRLATHVALECDGRPRPSPKHVACHTCDNPICTNPGHLWWGTEEENMQDAAAKGRLSNRKRKATL